MLTIWWLAVTATGRRWRWRWWGLDCFHCRWHSDPPSSPSYPLAYWKVVLKSRPAWLWQPAVSAFEPGCNNRCFGSQLSTQGYNNLAVVSWVGIKLCSWASPRESLHSKSVWFVLHKINQDKQECKSLVGRRCWGSHGEVTVPSLNGGHCPKPHSQSNPPSTLCLKKHLNVEALSWQEFLISFEDCINLLKFSIMP